jgi:hypothetical protein
MTPFLHHAFLVLNDWNRAKANDPIPWQAIKDGTRYVPPESSAQPTVGPSASSLNASVDPSATSMHTATGPSGSSSNAAVSPSAVHVSPPPVPSPVATMVSNADSAVNQLAIVLVTPPTPPVHQPPEISNGVPEATVPSLAPGAMPNTSMSAPARMVATQGEEKEGLEKEEEKGNGMGKGKGKGTGKGKGKSKAKEMGKEMGKGKDAEEAAGRLAPKQSKRRTVSPQMVPAHHLEEDGSAPPPPKRQKTLGSIPAMPTERESDRLWKTLANRPAPRCERCMQKDLVCETTGIQIACIACHATKNKCSYRPARTQQKKDLMFIGELPTTKAVRRAQRKQKQDEVLGEGSRVGKRKRGGDNTAAKTTGDERTIAGAVAGPSTSSTAPGTSHRHEYEEGEGSTNVSPATPIAASAALDTVQPPTTMPVIRVPTVGGLQRSLHDLQNLVAKLSQNQEILLNENVALQESVQGLLGLKEKIRTLEAEMRGLRSGMEWEKMKQEMAALRSELAETKDRLAEFEGSSCGEEEDGDENLVVKPAAAAKNMPRSTMYVTPDELRRSHWSLSPVVGSSSNLGGNNGTVPMAVDVPAPTGPTGA